METAIRSAARSLAVALGEASKSILSAVEYGVASFVRCTE